MHSDNKRDFYVKIRYNGRYINLCGKKDNTQCSYTDWKSRVKKIMTITDVDKFCGNKAGVKGKRISKDEGTEE